MPNPMLFASATAIKLRTRKLGVSAPAAATGGGFANHVAVLQSQGITDLQALGKLSISGIVIPQAGILRPTPGLLAPGGLVERTAPFSGVLHLRLPGAGVGPAGAELSVDRVGGTGNVLKVEPIRRLVPALPRTNTFRAALLASTVVQIPVAYWVADEITIADDTMIVLKQPHHWLVVLANKITLGTNVGFVWEQVNKGVPPQAPRRPKADTPPTSTTMGGTNGSDGANGSKGANGYDGDGGPEIEIWTLDLNRMPAEVLIAGQNGFQGGKGQDGQNGQNGARGRGFRSGYLGSCESGPGDGGDGGDGGNGGPGGRGGAGGRGGRFNLFAPAEVLNVVSAQGFYIDTKGGLKGPASPGGGPGAAGSGGPAGNQRDVIGCPTDFGHTGKDGSRAGASGVAGEPGRDGDHLVNAEALTPIKKADYQLAFNKPAIYQLSVLSGRVGDTVSAVGKGFADTDAVYVDNAKAVTTFVSDTLLTFVVPSAGGGRQKAVCVKQKDGTASNNATLQILPDILWIEQDGKRSTANPPSRFTPGKQVTVVGTGFSAGPTIAVNGQYVPAADVVLENSTKLSFTLVRPPTVTRNPAGEPVTITMTLRDGSEARPVQIVLDTLVMVVFGDSIQWGQGLREDLKFHSLVEQHVGGNGAIGVYKTVHAHSGATIGVGDNHHEDPVDGEVPTSYPTILQQVDLFGGPPALVDLVLLDGGINDIGVEAIVNPLENGELQNLIQQHCMADMKVLLKTVTQRFANAKIVVTGYFAIVSDDSSLAALISLLAGLGMLAGGPVAAAVAGGVSAHQKNVMESRSKAFAEQANGKLLQAVNEVKAENAQAGLNASIVFAKPEFQSKNAIFADDAWLWGIELDLGPADDYQLGGVEEQRAQACSLVESNDPSRTNETKCVRASLGHPNKAGAAEYARAIRAAL